MCLFKMFDYAVHVDGILTHVKLRRGFKCSKACLVFTEKYTPLSAFIFVAAWISVHNKFHFFLISCKKYQYVGKTKTSLIAVTL